ncbi:MAG TPA: ATP-binding protein [Verrucomicrobiae bacterium]|nr:ATP-binding protein [Verrucomicrobiae bacterium]
MNADQNDRESLRAAALETSKAVLAARQRAEESLQLKTKELADSLAIMQATLGATTDGILVINGNHKVVTYNEQFAKMWQIPREVLEANDENIRRKFTSEQCVNPAEFIARVEQILKDELPESFDLLKLANGKIFERYSKLLDANNPRFGRVWNFRDVTERELTQNTLQKAKNEAEKANKAKDDFIAVLSHELRTPLTPVLMMAQVLRENESLPVEIREHLAMMERNLGLEVRLIDDLLDITALSRGKIRLRPELCDAHSLIGLAIDIVRDEALTKEISIDRDFSARLSGLVVDPARFQQVIWNLLRNAVKFTPRGGRISIRTSDADGRMRIEVIDSGIGIEANEIEKIFLPFEQVSAANDHRFGGIGLGLAIARAIVNLHGGKINAASKGSNQGTTFTVEFPGAQTPPAGIDDASAHPPFIPGELMPTLMHQAGSRIRLLLVEDHAPTLHVMADLLTRSGFEIVSANNIAEAFEAAATNKFHLVISDLGLPDGSGIHLMEKLRDLYGLRGIALSGYGMEDDIARSYQAGFIHHLVKPVSIVELRRVLAKLDFTSL